ncbi:trans-sulfuration enzyme family protein [Kineothrix sp. MB12-C1]|uniref:trans-sulfuration enzyme family protein n=1 Tax=Kineothrix sp. MB12-C1 TaxID=3070215 RepID=UPI0027D34DCB|nr:PLP-dependent aspartate aminotransferase family protein [Kineothrix sp. MB12-C1]WMC93280.1 PLP-dependent aspartate aminotransferase family protein [Kineothrix sp. MB12-C1]
MEYGISTKCLYGDGRRVDTDGSGAVSFPIYQTATFAHPAVGESTGYDYSRLQNPTREQLERVVASLEKGIDALAFSSGMAAITALMEIFQPGDHIITDCDLYGGSIRLFNNISKKNGILFNHVNCAQLLEGEGTDGLEALIGESTKAIFIETPTNPMMNVTDICKMAGIAKKHGLLLIVDNTFLSPYFQNPLELGADVVVHSGTKYLGGHNDTIAGFLVTSSGEISEKLRFIIKTVGSGLAPFDSWLILRGIKTLAIRMEKAEKNTRQIVEWLCEQKPIVKVYYPGIAESPGYEITKRQARGFGCMVTFEVETKELALSILRKVRLIQFAESLGGVETLITYPITQTHADVPKETLAANGVTDKVLRLSVGIEDVEDLIKELERVFYE